MPKTNSSTAGLKEYAVPIGVTLLLHFVLLLWLATDFHSIGKKEPLVKQPKYIKATLVQMKEKKPDIKPKPAPKPKPVKKPDPPKPKVDKQKEAEKKKAEAERKKQLALKKEKEQKEKERKEKEKQEQEKRQREEQQRLLQEQLAREEQLMNMLDEEEEAANAAADQATAMSYMSAVRAAVESNWSRPPSARNGMQVVLAIQLVPTGDVVNVDVAESSGNEAFDRSAVTAVEKAERFPELSELEPHIFEKYYRRFKLVFKPEDLRL